MADPEQQRQAPWRLSVLLAVIDRLRAIDPNAAFIEASFPYQRLDFAVPNHGWLHPPLRRDVEPPQVFGTFSPNSEIRSGANLSALVRQATERGTSPWLVLEAQQAIAHRAYLGAVGIPMLVVGGQNADLPELAASGFIVTPFEKTDGAWCGYSAAIPTAMLGALGPEHGRMSRLAPDKLPRKIRINPIDMISDSPWGTGGDDAYSWLWTGPAICHRMCLGHPPVDARELRFELIESPHHEGLGDNLIVQINGRRVGADLSRIKGRGGSVRVPLPEGLAAPVVIGLCAFPDRPAPGDGARLIRVAFDAMEIVT